MEKDDDASHYTWNDILHAVRAPRTTLFSWVDSFTLRTLRYAETIEKISGIRLTKINKIIAKQITDDEKLTISTLNSTYSAIKIQDGAYDITELIQLLAQNVTSFTKRYQPTEHQRITRYLRTVHNQRHAIPLWKSKGGGASRTTSVKPPHPNRGSIGHGAICRKGSRAPLFHHRLTLKGRVKEDPRVRATQKARESLKAKARAGQKDRIMARARGLATS